MEIINKLNEDEIKSIIRKHYSDNMGYEVFLHNIDLSTDDLHRIICTVKIKDATVKHDK